MRVLACIEEAAVIRKRLDHLGLRDSPRRRAKQGRSTPVMTEEEAMGVCADSQVLDYEEAYDIPE